MKKLALLALAGLAAGAFASLQPGLLTVLVMKDTDMVSGEDADGLTSKRTVIRQYDFAGNQVGTDIELPSSASDPVKFTSQWGEDSEGGLWTSEDGRFITAAGYNIEAGVSDPGPFAARTVLRMASNGIAEFVNILPQADLGGDSSRFVYSKDGNQFWMTGGDQGVDYFTVGQSTSVPVVEGSSSRVLLSFNGDFYYTSSDDNFYNGSIRSNTLYKLNGQPTNPFVSPTIEFAFSSSPRTAILEADGDLYIASTTGSGANAIGVGKFRKNSSGIWTLQYSTGIAGAGAPICYMVKVGETLYGTRETNDPTDDAEIIKIEDTGTALTPSKLVDIPNTEVLRGITLGPVATQDIIGTVDLGEFDADAGRLVTAQLVDAGDNVIETTQFVLDSTGAFTVPTKAPNGAYRLRLKASHWISNAPVVNLTGSGDSVGTQVLTNGDVDGDNSITIFDYIDLSGSFDLSTGDAGFNAEADLDGDGSVTIFDYIILSNNFDLTGDGF